MYFKIEDRKLINYELYGWKAEISEGKGIGFFKASGVSYKTLNEFFRSRVVLDGSMMIREYLDALGLDHYDFEKIVKTLCGWNPADRIWVKFEGGKYQSYEQMVKDFHLKW